MTTTTEKTATIETSKNAIAYFNLENQKGSWLRGNYRNVNVMIDLKAKTVKMHGEHLVNHKGTTGIYEKSERVYTIGDVVEVGSYNLRYTGTIVGVGAKTIRVSEHGRIKMLKISEFTYRNLTLDMAKLAADNHATMMSI